MTNKYNKNKTRSNRKDNKDDNTTLKRIIIIIIIIIILLLITSCSSLFFGKIGNKWRGSSDYNINDEDKNWEKIYNKSLKFITKEGTTYVGDKYRVEFLEYNIHSNKFYCTTSDANIATCIVKDNYVEVHPRKAGKVTISVIAKINGKEYIGTHKLTVKEGRKEIKLSSSSGTINLMQENTIRVPYTLKNIFGIVKTTSSNSKVATAKVDSGAIVITGYRRGKATITVSVDYRGKTYSVTYDVTVVDNKKDSTTSNTMNTNLHHTLNNKNDVKGKSSENSLKFIKPSVGVLSPEFSKNEQYYTINLPYENDKIALDITRVSTTSKLYYYLDGHRVDGSNISLHTKTNRFQIVVEAENGSQKWYTVDIIRAEKDSEQPQPPIKSSINTLESLNFLKKMDSKMSKMKKGNYDLEDFLANLKQIKKLGPLENILKMLPGARKMGLNNVSINPKDFAHVEAIILSMTPYERKHPDVLKASRKTRISKGSGRSVEEINRLLKQFEQMKNMMKQISQGNMKLPF